MKYVKDNDSVFILHNGNVIKDNGDFFMQFVSEKEAIEWLVNNGWKEA